MIFQNYVKIFVNVKVLFSLLNTVKIGKISQNLQLIIKINYLKDNLFSIYYIFFCKIK